MKEREFLSSLATTVAALSRCIVMPTTSEATQSERKLLEEEIRNVFSNLLAPRDKIYLQVKDEEWGGIFDEQSREKVSESHRCRHC